MRRFNIHNFSLHYKILNKCIRKHTRGGNEKYIYIYRFFFYFTIYLGSQLRNSKAYIIRQNIQQYKSKTTLKNFKKMKKF